MNYSKLQLELIKHLKEQCDFLSTSGDLFDQGNLSEAKRIATQIRILVYHTRNCKSLLEQLKENFGVEIKILSHTSNNLLEGTIFYAGLTVQLNTEGVQYIPMVDLSHPALKEVSVEDWWNEIIIILNGENYTRNEILLGIANKDGGAHIDPKLEQRYFKLTREVKIFESNGQINMGKFELILARESGFYLLLALKKYFIRF